MNQEEKIDKILNLCQKQGKDIDEIKRGLYGDTINKLPGLIDRQLKDEMDIQNLKDQHQKAKWTAAGFASAITILVGVIWHFIKERFI